MRKGVAYALKEPLVHTRSGQKSGIKRKINFRAITRYGGICL